MHGPGPLVSAYNAHNVIEWVKIKNMKQMEEQKPVEESSEISTLHSQGET